MLNKKNILIIDDSELDIIYVSELLEFAGYNIFSANSGRNALAFLENNIPDLILLDIIMPEMNGFEVCEKIKQNKDLKEIPLLFLTSTTGIKAKLKGFELGAVDFIAKPFEKEELLARISTHITLQEYKLKLETTNVEFLKTRVRALESEKIYKTLFENLPNAFALHKMVFDKNNVPIDYIFIEVNNAFEKQLGLTRKQIIGKKVTEILPGIEKEPAGWIEKYGEVVLTEETMRFESFSEGLEKWFSVVAFSTKGGFFATIFDDLTQQKKLEKEKYEKSEEQKELFNKSEKQRIANLVILNDLNEKTRNLKAEISDRKRSEQIQKVLYNISNATNITDNIEDLATQIKEHLETIIDTTNFYIALYDKETDTFSIPFLVDEKEDVTIFPAGKSMTNYVLKTQKSLLVSKKNIKELIKTGDIEQFGTESEIWLGVPLKIAGKSIGVVAVQSYADENAFSESDKEILEFVSDQISLSIERKQADEKIRKYQYHLEEVVAERTSELSIANAELMKASRMKDEFLANMSHELRTPLNAVLGLSEALQEGVYGDLNPKQIEKTQHIAESGKHLLELINEILDLAKIEAGKIVLEYQQIAIENLIHSSLRFVKQQAFKKRINVSSSISDSIQTFRADEKRMKQILVNLLTNAVKFTPEGGKVGLDVTENKENQTISFSVWDTGIGISPEHYDKLFKPFVQIDSKLSRQYEGTGLGLALVQNLTELHGGSIIFRSEIEKGSKFIVNVPVVGYDNTDQQFEPTITKVSNTELLNSEKATKNDNYSDYNKKKTRILLAEDNDQNIEMIKEYLEIKHFSVIVARNGEEAVNMTEELMPEIILMDIQMPKMNGFDAIKLLRENKESKTYAIPIIAITALAMPGDEEKCIDAGANKYISKPVNLKNLVIIINEFLEK